MFLLVQFEAHVKKHHTAMPWLNLYQELFFLLIENKSVRTQGPHTGVLPDRILGKDILIVFIPLREGGLFVEVWQTHKSGEEPVKGDIVHVAYGIILLIDDTVVPCWRYMLFRRK